MTSLDLIKLYTVTGPRFVLADKWADTTKETLATYTKDGQRVHDLDSPYYRRKHAENCMFGFIHRENLSPTKKAAIEKREQIYRELFPTLYEV
jgi:hypothetical protein